MGWKNRRHPARDGAGSRGRKAARTALTAATALAGAQVASAGTFSNAQAGALANPGQTCGAAFVRTITVSETTPILDMDLGLLMTHPDRSDLAAAIRHPDGTQALLFFGGPNAVPNLNAVFDDEAATAVNAGSHTTADGTSAPPYENRVQPNQALSAFDGKSPEGDWLFLACDNTNDGNAGQFRRVDLFINPADLSLDIASNGAPLVNQDTVLDVAVTNDGPGAAGSVRVDLDLGVGLTFQSVSGATRNASGRFVVGNIPSGQTRTFQVTVRVESGGSYAATAQVWNSNTHDPDSTPANSAPGEDDQDTVTIQPGQTPPNQPPTLQCALGRPFNTLDWASPNDPNGWPAGSLSQTYTVNGVPVSVTFSGNTDRFIARNLGGQTLQTPVTDPQFTGARGNGDGVIMNVDFQSYAESVTITFDYGESAVGAGGIQIPIFDVDQGAWTDRIVATGTLGTTPVQPVYTTSSSNTVSNGGLTGNGGSSNTQGLGNSWITFPQSVDKVSITYSNVAAATGDPAAQVISIENLVYCDPEDPELSGAKTVEADGIITPGDTVTYRITASSAQGANVGADGITISDTLPDTVRFVSAQAVGLGTAGTFDPPLPAANTDCDGGACVVTYTGGALAREQSGEVVIQAIVK